MATAAPSEAVSRAHTISGCPGKATKVETSTIGLIAGEASMNVRAAAGATPRLTSAPATGTEAHSQPGRTAPQAPATGTARAGRPGRTRWKKPAGTNAAIAEESTTPSVRNGTAWTMTATNRAIQAWAAASPNSSTRPGRAVSPKTRSSARTSIEVSPRRRRAGARSAVSLCSATSWLTSPFCGTRGAVRYRPRAGGAAQASGGRVCQE